MEKPDPAPGRYVAVSDADFHTCALTEAGEALCWGRNTGGETEPPPGRYTTVSSGPDYTCALTEAGEAVCWGENRPEQPAPPPLHGDWRGVAMSVR